MKVGDILYVKKPYTAMYGKVGGSYDYFFVPGDIYEITYVHGVNGISIQNTNGDGVSHWFGSDIEYFFHTKDEWRERQLNEILI